MKFERHPHKMRLIKSAKGSSLNVWKHYCTLQATPVLLAKMVVLKSNFLEKSRNFKQLLKNFGSTFYKYWSNCGWGYLRGYHPPRLTLVSLDSSDHTQPHPIIPNFVYFISHLDLSNSYNLPHKWLKFQVNYTRELNEKEEKKTLTSPERVKARNVKDEWTVKGGPLKFKIRHENNSNKN